MIRSALKRLSTSRRLFAKTKLRAPTARISAMARPFSSSLATKEDLVDKAEYEVRLDIPRGKNREAYTLKVGDVLHNAWRVDEITPIPFFKMTAFKSTHLETGAQHIHLDCEDMDNVFAVLFRTPPDDSTGKPHILEHLATCGSKKYPVRDPFMQMLRRSLNTYMNAWTGSDFTMYPFSTSNTQDYRNLMSVYCDMAFQPLLHEKDFRQEGHRLEFQEWNNPKSPLEIKGVVYNEMRGAMSSPEEAFVADINANLFKESQYKYNSGGDPKEIPTLEYEDLVAFHKANYHPSNATFLTYGDLDFTDHLAYLQRYVLGGKYEKVDVASTEITVDSPPSSRDNGYSAKVEFMPDMLSDPTTQAKLGLTYVCNQMATDPYEAFKLHMLSQLLFEGTNSLFYKAIIEEGVAPAFCPGYGYDYTTKQGTLTVGVQGIDEKDVFKIENKIMEALQAAANEGFEQSHFEQVLHQMEFAAKKTQNHAGLAYLSQMVPHCLHGGDPLNFFKIDEYSQRVRQEFKEGDVFQELIRTYLLDNTHHLRLLHVPDATLADKQERRENLRMQALAKSLTTEEKETLVQEAYSLQEFQEKPQDQTVLPTLTTDEIERNIEFIDFTESYLDSAKRVKCRWYEAPTNGITYVRIKANLNRLPEKYRVFVPMFCELLPYIGTKNFKYDKFNEMLMSSTNGLEVSIDKYSHVQDFTDTKSKQEQVLIQTGFLNRNLDKAFECLSEILATPNFDAPENISDLIRMESVGKAQEMGNKGLEYGRSYANSGLRAHAHGFEKLKSDIFFMKFAQELLSNTNPRPLINDSVINMTEIASYLFSSDCLEFAVHGDADQFALVQFKLEMLVNQIKNENSRFLEDLPIVSSSGFKEPKYFQTFFKAPLAVNDCVESFLGPTYANIDDFAAGLVLSEIISHNFLLHTIREKGGAYGAGCRMNETGLIDFFSFRDPRVTETYNNFERAIVDAVEGRFGDREIEQGKLLAFQKLDKVLEPSLKGLIEFTRGYTDKERLQIRLRALDSTKEELQAFASKYLLSAIESGASSRVVFGTTKDDSFEGYLMREGWSVHNPMDFLSQQYFERWKE